MLLSKEHETAGKKSGISRKANPGWANSFSMCQAEDAVVKPVLGNIAVDEGIAGDMGKFEVENKSQEEGCESNQEKVSRCLPEDAPKRRSLNSNCRITVQRWHFAKYISSTGTTLPPELRDDLLLPRRNSATIVVLCRVDCDNIVFL